MTSRYPLFIVFLPYYLAANGAAFGNTSNYITYRDFTVSSVVGIFGPVVSMYMVSTRLRSRISMAITAAACVAFSGAFTTVKSEAQNLAFSSMTGFWLNAVYAILYGYANPTVTLQSLVVLNTNLMYHLPQLHSASTRGRAPWPRCRSPHGHGPFVFLDCAIYRHFRRR